MADLGTFVFMAGPATVTPTRTRSSNGSPKSGETRKRATSLFNNLTMGEDALKFKRLLKEQMSGLHH